MSDDFFLSLDTLKSMIEEVLSEYSDIDDDYLPADQVYNDLAWFYHAGLQDGGHFEIEDGVVDTFYDRSEGWAFHKLSDLGNVFEDYFLTGYHGGSTPGDY